PFRGFRELLPEAGKLRRNGTMTLSLQPVDQMPAQVAVHPFAEIAGLRPLPGRVLVLSPVAPADSLGNRQDPADDRARKELAAECAGKQFWRSEVKVADDLFVGAELRVCGLSKADEGGVEIRSAAIRQTV